ncbi:MAG TPA: hypothetical protein VLK82_16115 [Candidatus Tectomicrobia bacterium]|nr:hypothetical protein [Candidatus Tectomicrobia bacterium]
MTRNNGIGLMICALVFMALARPGHAADATIRANAAIQGEGRFYRATEDMILFSGFYQGAINVTNQQGDLVVNAASLTCPGTLEVNTTTKTTEGEGRCLFLTQDGTYVYARWTCTGKPGAGCGGTFKVLGGTGRFKNASGQGDFMMTSTLTEVVVTIPQGGVTGTFTGKVEWPELKLTTK